MFRNITILFFGLALAVWLMPRFTPGSPPAPSPSSPTPSSSPLPPLPDSYTLSGGTHVFQTFNNCGPAALSMALSYLGITATQQELGRELRPWQNAMGDNDDKSVTLSELADMSSRFGLTPYHRPAGNAQVLRQLVSLGLPIITRTWTYPDEDIGHYRVVKGFDRTRLLQDDSLQGKNLWYTDTEFNEIWAKFNYEFLVMVPDNKIAQVEKILGQLADWDQSWELAAKLSRQALNKDPADIQAGLNLSVALYHLKEYQSSVEYFEAIESRLPSRALWYQLEPVQAYYQVGNYDRVLSLTSQILASGNRAYSEAYLLRGQVYQELGDYSAAREQYQLAIRYHPNFTAARTALNNL